MNKIIKLFKKKNTIIKHQRKIIEKLRKEYNDVYFDNFEMYHFVDTLKTNYEGARGAMQQILKRNTLKEAKYYAKIGLMYMDMRDDVIKREIKRQVKLYKKEISNEIKKKINEVLKDAE